MKKYNEIYEGCNKLLKMDWNAKLTQCNNKAISMTFYYLDSFYSSMIITDTKEFCDILYWYQVKPNKKIEKIVKKLLEDVFEHFKTTGRSEEIYNIFAEFEKRSNMVYRAKYALELDIVSPEVLATRKNESEEK